MPRVLKPTEKAMESAAPFPEVETLGYTLWSEKPYTWHTLFLSTFSSVQIQNWKPKKVRVGGEGGWGGLTEPAMCDQQPTPKPAVKYAEND